MSSLFYKGKKFEITFQEFFPFFMDYQWSTKAFYDSFKNLSGFSYDAITYYPKGLQLEKYIAIEEVKSKTRVVAESKKESPRFFIQQDKEYRRKLSSLEKQIGSLSKERFFGYSNDDLAEIFFDLHQKIEAYNAFSNWYYILSLEIESLLRDEWKNASPVDIQETLLSLASPYHPNATERFSKELKKAAKKYKKADEDKKVATLLSETKKIAGKFYWLTNFSGVARTPQSFVPDIQRALLNLEHKDKPQDVKLPVPKGWIVAMSVATYIKDDVSTYFIPWYWHTLLPLWEIVRQRIGLQTKEELWYFSYDEIISLLKVGDVVSPSDLALRQIAMTSEQSESGVKVRKGKEAEDFFHSILDKTQHEKVTELKGNAAYPGRIRGKVRIIKERGQFNSFIAGEILVAPYTAPEYVPLMQRAIAIITDTGGITSHAAIVSRELKVPCIVNTKIATKVLKDGDMVEVDATTGKVLIL